MDRIEFPITFPPKEGTQLGDYADKIEWPTKEGQDLWAFYRKLFEGMLTKKCTCDLIDSNDYAQFLEARRVTSQFWDSWAREIINGSLKYSAIARPTDANMRAIRAVAIAELAVASVYQWDKGPGKTPLFRLAKEGEKIGHEKWAKQVLAKIGSLLIAAGNSISPNNRIGKNDGQG